MIVDLQLLVDGLHVNDLNEVEQIVNDFEGNLNTIYPVTYTILNVEE